MARIVTNLERAETLYKKALDLERDLSEFERDLYGQIHQDRWAKRVCDAGEFAYKAYESLENVVTHFREMKDGPMAELRRRRQKEETKS